MDGIRLRYKPTAGLYLKAIAGVQRYYWDSWSKEDDRGVLSGADAELHVNEAFKALSDKHTRLVLGGSFLTRYQKDNHPIYKTPRNTAGFAGRFSLTRKNLSLLGEYAYKINDPSADNGMIYKPGDAMFLQGSYAVKGFSLSLTGKRLDNMSFRSDRNAGLNDLTINYLPSINKQHIYALPATYPYATQPRGEIGYTASVGYKIKKGTWLGGKYGTDISVNYSKISDIARDSIDQNTGIGQPGTLGYTSELFGRGDLFFEDLSVELQKKITKDLKITLLYAWMFYNIAVIEGHPGEEDVVSNHVVGDLTWRITSRKALRFELQHLSTEQDEGNWVLAGLEYSNKGVFAGIQNQWNYGNPEEDRKIHYIMVSTGYAKGATRISASYGRQNDGIVCIGGVCRFLPAISGFSLTITSSF